MKNQNLNSFTKLNYLVLLTFISLFFLSCGSNKVVISPNYSNSSYEKSDLKRDNVKIIKVYDKRTGLDTNSVKVGTAKVGMFNKEVPYLFNIPVSTFVEKSINKMIIKNTASKKFVPVTVIIDTFTVYEKMNLFNESGIFKTSMNFTFPISLDSFGIVSTHSLQEATSGMDVTDNIEGQIYLGMKNCTEQFIDFFDKSAKYNLSSDSIPKKFSEEKSIPKEIKEKAYAKVASEKTKDDALAFTYYSGDRIKDGFGLNYINFFINKESQFINGLGYGIIYLDIKDTKDITQASLFAFRAKYIPRYYFSNSKSGLYLGGGLSLTFGTEKIGQESNFFFGPTLEEHLGFKLGPIFIEGGLYQLVQFNSKILHDDTGFIVGFGVEF